jgi:hypothetical protein
MMLQIVGVNIGMPLILMLMDGSETNFSGWRGAMDQAKMGFKHNQKWFSRKLCRPTYIWRVRRRISAEPAIRHAFEKLGTKVFDHRWDCPRWPYVQPLQDAQADSMQVEKRLTSPRRKSSERGIEQVDLAIEIVADNKDMIIRAIQGAKEIKALTGEKVDWHELLYVSNENVAKTIGVTAPADDDDAPPAGPAKGPLPPGSPPAKKDDDSEEDDDDKADPHDKEKDE